MKANHIQDIDSLQRFPVWVSVKVSGNLLVTLQILLIFVSFVISMCHNF